MKRLLSAIAGLALFMSFGMGKEVSAGVVVGKVDIQKILVSVNESKKIREKLKSIFEKKKAQLEKEEKKIIKMQEDFEKQSVVMNAKAKQKRQREIEERVLMLRQTTLESQKEMEKVEDSYKRPMVEKIRKIVDEVSKKEGVDFTYEASRAGIIYSKESKDLTDQVVKLYNKRHKKS